MIRRVRERLATGCTYGIDALVWLIDRLEGDDQAPEQAAAAAPTVHSEVMRDAQLRAELNERFGSKAGVG